MFQVTFTPSATGLRTATITIPNNDSTNPNPTVSLSGTGVQPGTIQFSSATYSVSETGPTATITVKRTGGSDGADRFNMQQSRAARQPAARLATPVLIISTRAEL